MAHIAWRLNQWKFLNAIILMLFTHNGILKFCSQRWSGDGILENSTRSGDVWCKLLCNQGTLLKIEFI